MMNNLILQEWDDLEPFECEAHATQIGHDLPIGFTFHRIRAYRLGSQERYVAEFKFQNSMFVLIPGGETTIGYDTNRAWEPTPDEHKSWLATSKEYGIEDSIIEFVLRSTLRPRSVSFTPFLMEISADEVGWQSISSEDPEVKEIVEEHLRHRTGQVTVRRGHAETRVHREGNGTIRAERSDVVTHEVLSQRLLKTGFRFPTPNEWEYACGGGSSTLFRWGDHVPCDRYPTDISPQETAWRRAWVLSKGKIEYPPEGFTADWDLHRRPNAFGVYMASDPYKIELTAEPGITRGGDGGTMICGGAGFFIAWITLATAYFEDHSCRQDPSEPILPECTISRRVLPLA